MTAAEPALYAVAGGAALAVAVALYAFVAVLAMLMRDGGE